MGRKYLQITFLTKAMYSECIFKISKLNDKIANNPIKKWAKDLNRIFGKEDIRIVNVNTRKMLNIISR